MSGVQSSDFPGQRRLGGGGAGAGQRQPGPPGPMIRSGSRCWASAAGGSAHRRLQQAQGHHRRRALRRRLPALRRADQEVEDRTGKAPQLVGDLRRIMDDKSIDVVSIATPNHWHALAAIWACQAGKDVYVEKPVSHNVSEGRQIVEAREKYDRIVQTGTQSRSLDGHARRRWSSSTRASSARSTWPRASATSPAARSATRPTRRCPTASTTTSGSAPRRAARSTRTGSTTTGTGSGTTATATSATRASTRWTSPAGAWARTLPNHIVSQRRPVRLQGRRRDAQHPDRRVRVRRLPAPVRGPRPADQRRAGRQDRQHLLRHRGLLAINGDRWQTFLGHKRRSPARRQRRRRPLRQLRPGRQSRKRRADRRDHRGPPLQRPVPPGNISYRLGRALLRPQDRDVRRRQGGRRDVDARVPLAVHDARERLTSVAVIPARCPALGHRVRRVD